jgi:ribonuclease M5
MILRHNEAGRNMQIMSSQSIKMKENELNKNSSIRQIIVVEGRDDTAAVRRALDADTIETHGFGISSQTWALLRKAYNERGLIIFTDPDHAGENIRKLLAENFPEALHAYLDRADATEGSDIGIENAKPEAIRMALEKVKAVKTEREDVFTMEDMRHADLAGGTGAAQRRAAVGKILGVGTGNSKAFLKKLNGFGITREAFDKALAEFNEQKGS